MREPAEQGITREGALRLEFFIIGLGIFALVLIFQPFSLTLFAVGSVLVVIAGLINNLLPMAQPGVPVRSSSEPQPSRASGPAWPRTARTSSRRGRRLRG